MKQSYGRLLAARLMSPAAAMGVAAALVAGVSACHNNSSTPCPNLSQASVVIGQPNFTTGTPPDQTSGGISASDMGAVGSVVTGVVSGTTYLYIADQSNNRVLVYQGIPTTNGAAATAVLGQACFTATATTPAASVTQCGGSATQPAIGLNNPSKVSISDTGTQLVVADTGNNRVLIWNSLPTSSTQGPDVVVGQTSIATTSGSGVGCNTGGESAYTLCGPTAAMIANGQLVVVDKGNNRVLVYNTVPGSNGAAADVELGQPNVQTGTDPTTHQSVTITCSSNTSTTATDGVPANFCFTTRIPGTGDVFNPSTTQYDVFMNAPTDVWTDGSQHLFVSDTNTNRVLAYTTFPTPSNGQNPQPTYLIGEQNFDQGYTTPGSGSQKFSGPTGLWSDGTSLYISDTNNNRVLQFPLVEITTNLVAAQEVFGQQDFGHTTQNDPDQNNQVGDQRNNPATIGPVNGTLWNPYGVYANNAAQLFITDSANYRVLIYPAANGVNGTFPNLCS